MSFVSFIKNNFIDMANDNTSKSFVHTFRPDPRWRIWRVRFISFIKNNFIDMANDNASKLFVHIFCPDTRWRIWRVEFMLNFIKITEISIAWRRHVNLYRELSEACSRSITKIYSITKNNFIWQTTTHLNHLFKYSVPILNE